MSICASGASTTKAGVPAGVIVDQAYVKSLLPSGWSWLYDYLPYAKNLAIGDVSSFCAADPPTFSVPTALELLNFITGGNLNDYLTVSTFVQNLTKAYLWHQLCQCTSGATPAAPSASAAPTGIAVVNPPPYVAPSTGQPCFAYPDGAQYNVSVGSSTLINDFGVWTNSTRIIITLGNVRSGVTHGNHTWTVTIYDNFSAVLYTSTTTVPSGQFVVLDVPVINAASVVGSVTAPGVTDLATEDVKIYCFGDTPPTSSNPCTNCPPDPFLVGVLSQLASAVQLIQRQSAPFGYVYGTNHTVLSGTGAITIADLIGVSVDVTTQPSSYGTAAGTPVEIFDLGFVTLGTADGYETSRRIDHDGTLFLPPNAGVFTSIGYTLSPGVVVSIRELVREP